MQPQSVQHAAGRQSSCPGALEALIPHSNSIWDHVFHGSSHHPMSSIVSLVKTLTMDPRSLESTTPISSHCPSTERLLPLALHFLHTVHSCFSCPLHGCFVCPVAPLLQRCFICCILPVSVALFFQKCWPCHSLWMSLTSMPWLDILTPKCHLLAQAIECQAWLQTPLLTSSVAMLPFN